MFTAAIGETRGEIAASCQAVHDELVHALKRVADHSGIRLTRPGAELAGTIGAALHGLALQRVVTPSTVPDGVFDGAVAAILEQAAERTFLDERDALPFHTAP